MKEEKVKSETDWLIETMMGFCLVKEIGRKENERFKVRE